MKDLLDGLAATAPEPTGDPVAEVHRRVRRRRPARRLVPVLVALGTVAAVLAAVGVVSLTQRSQQPTPPITPPAPPGAAALAAARHFTTLYYAMDPRSSLQRHRDLDSLTTGAARQDLDAAWATLVLQRTTPVAATVLAAAARDVNSDTATVLLAVDQTITNRLRPAASTTNRYRVLERLSLVTAGGSSVRSIRSSRAEPAACPDGSALLAETCPALSRLFSFDYRTRDADLAAQRKVTTGAFTAQLASQDGPEMRSLASREHVVTGASAGPAAVERQDARSAVVLAVRQPGRHQRPPAATPHRPQPARGGADPGRRPLAGVRRQSPVTPEAPSDP